MVTCSVAMVTGSVAMVIGWVTMAILEVTKVGLKFVTDCKTILNGQNVRLPSQPHIHLTGVFLKICPYFLGYYNTLIIVKT